MNNSTTLVFADVETGTRLDDSGAWDVAGRQFQPRFDSRADAEAFMKAYLEKHPTPSAGSTTMCA